MFGKPATLSAIPGRSLFSMNVENETPPEGGELESLPELIDKLERSQTDSDVDLQELVADLRG